jgi:hypothetical protein
VPFFELIDWFLVSETKTAENSLMKLSKNRTPAESIWSKSIQQLKPITSAPFSKFDSGFSHSASNRTLNKIHAVKSHSQRVNVNRSREDLMLSDTIRRDHFRELFPASKRSCGKPAKKGRERDLL